MSAAGVAGSHALAVACGARSRSRTAGTRASGWRAPRCSASKGNGNGNGNGEKQSRAGVRELLSSSEPAKGPEGLQRGGSIPRKPSSRRNAGQKLSSLAADIVSKAAELDSLCDVEDAGPGLQEVDRGLQSAPEKEQRKNQKAEFFLVRTDGYICTREKVDDSSLRFLHPTTQQQMLMWKTRPKCVLLIKKLGDDLLPHLMKTARYLRDVEKVRVIVERDVYDRLGMEDGFGFVETYSAEDWHLTADIVDVVVCLGGDGVILHASTLFSEATPPIVSFALGSLGFLTAHEFSDHKEVLRNVLNSEPGNHVKVTLRMRLRCEVLRNGVPIPGQAHDVVNEVVVHRGSNPYLSLVECYERDRLITKVQADGVLLATPTGSTAYNVASGGSMVHPNVPAILFTPICPHSLSFRPVILPDSAELELKIPLDARSTMWVCFDGKKRRELLRGDSIRVRMSEFPIPTVNKNDQTDDWFASLSRCLNWNERLLQKPITGGYAELFASDEVEVIKD